ncbi:MAG: MFS transporter [Mogibacterium sp.]|nr:MFS transporter [Mogibacterium sp.]
MATTHGSKLTKNSWRLALISLCGSLIYGLPYFRSYVYDAYLATYNLTNTQMGTFGSIFGVMGACSYLFGGVVADLVKPRMLMSVSLILTGLAGILHLFNPSYGMLIVIYLVWGFTSLFAFWPSLLKSLRAIANEREQSKVYGFMDGLRGIFNAIHASLLVVVFNAVGKGVNDRAGINGIIVYYSVIVIVLGILAFFFLKDEDVDEDVPEKAESDKFNFKDIGAVLKLPVVWMLSIILLCSYNMNMLYWYFTPYATARFGMAASAAALITVLAQYVRPIASFSGGIVADRIGRANVMYGTFGMMLIATLVLILSGGLSSTSFIIVSVVCYFGMYAAYSMVFSMLEESGVPAKIGGTAIGLICTIGYLPEIICPLLAGKFLDAYGDDGYRRVFIYLAIMMAIGIIMLTLYKRYVAAHKAEIEAAKNA